ncbi:KIFBP [Symbiodinium sp. CCMP2592]|nr:KIFBP [Symbiodinium sp. CCMP2592]
MSKLETFLVHDVDQTLKKYDDLWTAQDPEDNPYKSKYVAREMLEMAVKNVENLVEEEASIQTADRGREVVARLLLFLGKNCYFCEEAGPDLVVTSSVEAHTSPAQQVPQAEKCFIRSLERYLRSPLRLEPEPFCYIQALFCAYWDAVMCITSSQLTIVGGFQISAAIACQDVFNQLGMLWCNRGGHKAGMLSFLSSHSLLVMLDGHMSSAQEGMNFLRRAQVMYMRRPQHVRDVCEERCENNYTMTMFYLAQAYGALQKPALSARFCAETMSRQLESNSLGLRSREITERDPFDAKDWIRNCCALSDFFINDGMFWTAEYLLHSALVMCERGGEIVGSEPENITELKAECMRDIGNMYATRLKFARACAERPDAWEEVWRGERKQEAEEQTVPDEGTKLSFRVSADRVERPPEGGTGPIHWDDIFPEVVHLEDDEAQDNIMAEEHEIFKLGNHFFAHALDYFLLDGWVTEHVRILQELSTMYRTLQYWEKDPKRSAAMLKRRRASRAHRRQPRGWMGDRRGDRGYGRSRWSRGGRGEEEEDRRDLPARRPERAKGDQNDHRGYGRDSGRESGRGPWGRGREEDEVVAPPLTVSGCQNETISAIIAGVYMPDSLNHGKVVYKKREKSRGLDVLIYFWDERDGPELCGWWFGPNVGGDQVWAYHPSRTAGTPPASEWNVPHDGDIDPSFTVSAMRSAPSPPPAGEPSPSAARSRTREARAILHFKRLLLW